MTDYKALREATERCLNCARLYGNEHPRDVDNATTILSLLDALATARIDALEEVRRATEDNADDEAEQNAFEAWGAAEKYNMTKHPMHWLFLDNQTYNARKGWRGALAHVDAVIRALKVKS